ncbi:MAG: holB [Gammaproteobacteria bacterium]|jgi:DNA polymerase-3 subunit delta'|nr:holB [Gammaproteobacteria bacterium]
MQDIYPWQQHQWSHLNALLAQGRFPHALLLHGSKNLGKRLFALALAKRLLCRTKGAQACEHCQSCYLLRSGNHPDLHLIEPLEKAKAIKVEQVRALVATLAQTSQQGGKRVAIFYPAEAMNMAAANALLKTLEEPLNDVIFLLVSHEPSNIPATVRSRCQRAGFSVPGASVGRAWLKVQSPEIEKLDELLALAENIPLSAFNLSRGEGLSAYIKVITCFLDVCLSNVSPSQAGALMLNISTDCVFNALWSVTTGMIRLKLGGIEMGAIQYAEKLREASRHINLEQLFKLIDELMVFKKKVNSKVALNHQLLLEDLLIACAQRS